MAAPGEEHCCENYQAVVGGSPVLLITLLLGTAGAQTEERREATVKGTAENNRVVIITGLADKAPIELQCNKGFSGCTPAQAE
jgi:hypothetical protein